MNIFYLRTADINIKCKLSSLQFIVSIYSFPWSLLCRIPEHSVEDFIVH